MFQKRNHCDSNCFFPLCNVSFCLDAFKILSLVFRIIIIICIAIDPFRHILFQVHLTLLLCRFVSFTKFNKFSAIHLGNILSHPPTFYSLARAPIMQVMDPLLLSQKFQDPVLLKLLFYIIYFFRMGKFFLFSSPLILSSVISHYYQSHTASFLFVLIECFSFIRPILFFL